MNSYSKALPLTPDASYPITARAATLNILLYLVNLPDRNDSLATRLGLQADDLAMLRNMSVQDICKLTDQGQPLVRISVDPRQLRLSLARARMRDDVEATKRWFIQRGTPHVLMQELYGTPIREFREMRTELDATTVRPGRPRVLKSAQAERVRELWKQLGSRTDLIERYKRIGEAFPEHSIASLYGAIHDNKM